MRKVSIIIPYKEDRGYLQQAIDSVYNQTYQGEIELILSQSNEGVSYNLNKGIENATGDYIKYLCDDDMLTPNSINDSVEAIKGFDFIHGNAINLHKDRKEYHRASVEIPTFKRMKQGNVIHGGTLMYKREVFEDFGDFDETLWTGEEYEFNLRILSMGAKIGYCSKFLYYYRWHENQKSLGRKANQALRTQEINRIKKMYV